MDIFECTTPEELSILAVTIAITLSKDRTPSEIEILGGLLTVVADTLALIASQQQALIERQEKKEQIKDLKKQIEELKH